MISALEAKQSRLPDYQVVEKELKLINQAVLTSTAEGYLQTEFRLGDYALAAKEQIVNRLKDLGYKTYLLGSILTINWANAD